MSMQAHKIVSGYNLNAGKWSGYKQYQTTYDGITRLGKEGRFCVILRVDFVDLMVGKYLTLKMAVFKHNEYIKKNKLNIPLLKAPTKERLRYEEELLDMKDTLIVKKGVRNISGH